MSELETEVPAVPVVESPGKLLRQAREAANWSQRKVADELRVSLSKVVSIESDDFDKLHSATFIRGYLRSYAKLMNLDGAELVGYYEQLQPRQSDEQETPEVEESEGFNRIWLLLPLAVALVVIVTLLDGNHGDAPTESVENSDAAAAAFVSSDQLNSEGALEVAPQPADSETPVEQTQGSETQAEEKAVDVLEVSDAVEAAGDASIKPALSVDSLDVLAFEFSDDCWVEVTDSLGDVLFVDVQHANDSLQLKGRAPFSVKLGNARAASLKLNDQPVEIAPQPGHKVLKLTVAKAQ